MTETKCFDKRNQDVLIFKFTELKNTFLNGIYGNNAYFGRLSTKQFRKLCEFLSQIIQIHDDQSNFFPNGQRQEELAKAVELLIGADWICWFPGDNDVEIYFEDSSNFIVVGLRNTRSYLNDMRIYAKYDLT